MKQMKPVGEKYIKVLTRTAIIADILKFDTHTRTVAQRDLYSS